MELRQSRHFLAIAVGGSLGDAARTLKMTQPVLTRSLQSRERGVGTPLFARTRKGMVLNQFGRALDVRARIIASSSGRAARQLRALFGLEPLMQEIVDEPQGGGSADDQKNRGHDEQHHRHGEQDRQGVGLFLEMQKEFVAHLRGR